LHPHTALPGASPKDHGEGRPETDTLTVSSRTTPRNKNTGKPTPPSSSDASRHSAAHAERRGTTASDSEWAIGKAQEALSGAKALLEASPPERFG